MTRMQWLSLATLAAIFTPGVLQLAEIWASVDYYGHGFFVPLVSLWDALGRRARLADLEATTDGRGLAALAAAGALYAVGLLAGSPLLIGLAVVGAVSGTVLALRGAAWLRELRFALLYLVFMVPVPESWLSPLIGNLQLAVSGVAFAVLRAFELPVLRDGNVLELPGGASLFVDEACSGITSIVTLVPIGFFVAWFTERTVIRRSVLVAAVLPIALAGNLLRVIGTVLLALWVDVEFATTGPLHEWAGVATYVLGCAALLAVGAFMRWRWPQAEPA